MAFAQRIINLRFQLGEGAFGNGGNDTVDLTGLRCSVNITKAGSLGNQDCEARIWGMPLDLMNKLTILNKLAFGQQLDNVLTVFAGDDQHEPSAIFAGTIMEAWADGRDPPDMMFHVSATAGLVDMIKPGDPISFKGDVDAATALGQVARAMGLSLENSGVTGTLHSPYWPGSIGMQLRAICEALDCYFVTDYVNKVLAVWPIDSARQSDAVLISPQTGLRGYPSFTQDGLQIVSLFNPLIAYGRQIEVKSQFSAANGSKWVVASVSHNLDSNIPDGEWFTQVECGLFGYPIPLIS